MHASPSRTVRLLAGLGLSGPGLAGPALAGLALAAVTLSGCALGTDRVTLVDPMAPTPEKWHSEYVESAAAHETPPPGPDAPRFRLVRVDDARDDTSAVGTQRNTFGSATGSVRLEEGSALAQVAARHLRSCFRSAGYELELEAGDSAPVGFAGDVGVTVTRLWTDMDPGFWKVSAVSEACVDLEILRPGSGEPVFAGSFEGAAKKSGGGVSRRMFEQSLNEAWGEAMRALALALRTEVAESLATPAP